MPLRSVLLGEHKVCGLTRGQDVKASYAQGALYGGLILLKVLLVNSPYVKHRNWLSKHLLLFVGVFQNHSIAFIHNIATQLQLFAVQLHGDENAEFITALRQVLPTMSNLESCYELTLPSNMNKGKVR